MGVAGLEPGELYVKSRFREGVVGSVEVVVELERTGDDGLASAGVTSVCKIDVKIVFACST